MVCRAAHVGPSKPHTIVVRSVPGRVSIAHCCCCSNPCVRQENADYHLTSDPLPAFLITMLPACHPSPLPQNKGFLELRSQALKHFGWQARRRRVDAGCPLCDSMRERGGRSAVKSAVQFRPCTDPTNDFVYRRTSSNRSRLCNPHDLQPTTTAKPRLSLVH